MSVSTLSISEWESGRREERNREGRKKEDKGMERRKGREVFLNGHSDIELGGPVVESSV